MSSTSNFASMSIIVEKDDSGQDIPCRSELEIASFLALVESKRKKGGGLFKKEAQKISFVSYVGWPFLILKKSDSNSHVVFDMLNFFSHKIDSEVIPDTDGFIENIRSQSVDSAYIAELKTHQETFKKFVGNIPHTIPAYMESNELINDFIQQSKLSSIENIGNFTYLLPSRLSDEQAIASLDNIIKLKEDAIVDFNKIISAKDAVVRKSREWNEFLEDEKRKTKDKYNSQIDKLTPEVQTAVSRLQRDMSREIHSIDMSHSEKMTGYRSSLSKYQNDEIKHIQMGPTHQKSADIARHNKNGVLQQISQLESETQNRKSKLRKYYDDQIQAQWQMIRSLEENRDTQVNSLEMEQKEISEKTTLIDQKLSLLAVQKNQFIEKIEKMGVKIPTNLSSEFSDSPFLIYVPMLVACLQTDKKPEWLVYPPMVFKKSKGLVDSFKGLMGGITLPLESRTESLKILEKRFEEELENDVGLADELLTHCQKHDMLDNSEAKTKFSVGIEMIKEKKWLKDKHFQELKSGIESQFKT